MMNPRSLFYLHGIRIFLHLPGDSEYLLLYHVPWKDRELLHSDENQDWQAHNQILVSPTGDLPLSRNARRHHVPIRSGMDLKRFWVYIYRVLVFFHLTG